MSELTDKQKKKADQLLNGLKTGQQKIPSAAVVQVVPTIEKEVVKRVNRIKSNVEIMTDSKKQIIEDLNFLKEHQTELTKETGLTFEAFIKDVAGYSKSYFYQLTANYEFLKENNKIDLLDKVDTKIIEEIKKIDNHKLQQEYLKKAETLTRADFNQDRVRRSDFVKGSQTAQDGPGKDYSRPPTVTTQDTVKKILDLIEHELRKYNKDESDQIVIDVINKLRKRK
jgi:hypothetical protein